MKKFILCAIALIIAGFSASNAQKTRDKGVFIEPKNEFMDTIIQSANQFKNKSTDKEKVFKVDFSSMNLPTSVNQFKKVHYLPPVSQGLTGTCWCFSTLSLIESEIYRMQKKDIKLSEMYVVYWEYVEKTRRFIKTRGNSVFAEGSQSQGVTYTMKQYGLMPISVYNGLQPGQKFHDHEAMIDEMTKYLQNVKNTNAWNEDEAIATIKSIMNHYMGEPPQKFEYEGKEYTPITFWKEVTKINPDDYIDFMSLMEKPYNTETIYNVPDNWRRDSTSYNVPLDDFMSIVKKAIRNGYSLCIGGDVSEAGMESHAEVAMVPSFDIPSEYIDENARQFRFSNGSTTDDHGIHLVGYMEQDGKDWYLIKDSGSGAKNGKNWGFYFFSEDYIKLKMMNAMVHKSAVDKKILDRFEK